MREDTECEQVLREWFVEQVHESIPIEAAEVVLEVDGKVPPNPSMSGENNDPTDQPWRYLHNIKVTVPDPSATEFVARLRQRVAQTAEADRSLEGRFDRAEIEVGEPVADAEVIVVPFSTSVGFPPPR